MNKHTLTGIRRQRQLSVNELARKVGAAASAIRRIEMASYCICKALTSSHERWTAAPNAIDWFGDPFGMGAWR